MLRVTVASSSGCSAPAATPVNPGEAGSEIQPITSVYEAVDSFIIDVKFEGKYEDLTDPMAPAYTYQNAVNVTSTYNWSNIGVTMTKPNAYTVRLTGPGLDVFTDQYYRFVLTDFTQQILPPDTTIPFFSLTKYKKPSANTITLSYPFTVTIPSSSGGLPNTTESENVPHDFWWSFSVAAANISRLKAQGLK